MSISFTSVEIPTVSTRLTLLVKVLLKMAALDLIIQLAAQIHSVPVRIQALTLAALQHGKNMHMVRKSNFHDLHLCVHILPAC